MKVHYPKLYNMAHLLALNVLLLPKDLTIIFILFSSGTRTLLTITYAVKSGSLLEVTQFQYIKQTFM